MAERVYLTVAEVIAIHYRSIEAYGGSHGIREQSMLESAVFRPQTGYYNDLAEEAAALMDSLVNNHVFIDGNKRIAFDAMHTFLLLNGFTLEVDPLEAYAFMMESIASGEFRFAAILDWLRAHIKPLD